MKKRPNIVIFNPDQWRGDVLGHNGNPAAVTPNLDKMVKTDGVSFVNTFCQNPVCTPSRCSFMSGWYPHVKGHRTMHHMMKQDEPVLLKTLKDNGYFVWWGGKNDLIPGQNPDTLCCDVRYKPDQDKKKIRPIWQIDRESEWRGKPGSDKYYSFYVGKLDKGTEEVYFDNEWAFVHGAIDFIENNRSDKPFCIYLPLTYPHPPYAVEEPWYSMIDRNKMPKRIPVPKDWKGKPSLLKGIYENQHLQNFTEKEWTELRATYYGMCARVDHQYGLMIKALKDASLYDDTAVFFFSDHGDFTGDYGLVEKTQNTFEDCLSNVPFVVKLPKSFDVKPGIRENLVELIDFPATVEEITGIKPEHTHFGRSLVPLMQNEKEEHRDAVFCEGGRLHKENHCMEDFNRSKEHLYWPRTSLQRSEGPEHTKAVMCRTKEYKYIRRLYESDEFYDLKKDPQELKNCITEPEYQRIISQHKERMLTFFMETGDVVPFKVDKR